jgi:hypothetical protein
LPFAPCQLVDVEPLKCEPWQMMYASFECNGPLMVSKPAKLISVQRESRPS